MTLRRNFFLKNRGAFPKNKKGTSLFIAKSWGAPSAPPVPTSMKSNKQDQPGRLILLLSLKATFRLHKATVCPTSFRASLWALFVLNYRLERASLLIQIGLEVK